jgi:poly(3-hydroxybutyrate) depolymerase
MKPLSSLLIIAWLALFCVGSAGAADEVQRHLEVYDLPQHRLTGDPAERKDHPVAMNIFVPSQPSGPRPCIILVHGGGWGGGDIGDAEKIRGGRSYGHGHDLIAAGLARGFVMVNFNYHLSPKGIFPQVYDDFRDAVRFLRANAATYQIDPTRIGATGFSAGGWLLGTACWVNGEYAVTSATARNAMPLADLLADKVRKRDPGVYLPMGQERTEYPQQYALIQAVSYDFQHNFERLLELKEFPAINRWCGLDVKL